MKHYFQTSTLSSHKHTSFTFNISIHSLLANTDMNSVVPTNLLTNQSWVNCVLEMKEWPDKAFV